MIFTLIKAGLLSLRRSPVELLLIFVVPVAFFSIFAMIFGGTSDGTAPIKVAIVDEAFNDASKRLIASLKSETSLNVQTTHEKNDVLAPLTRDVARDLLQRGKIPVALVIPIGFALAFDFSGTSQVPIEMMVDSSDQIAPQMVNGLLQKCAMTAAPDLMASSGIDMFAKWGGGLTEAQQQAVDSWLPRLQEGTLSDNDKPKEGAPSGFTGLIQTKTVDVLGKDKKNPVVAFYAAAIAVMFLLFSSTGGGGTLLEEELNGTLERLLTTRLNMTQMLLGKWAFLSLVGVAQITLMFVFANLVFAVEFYNRLPGFFIMTIGTAGAASAFGLMMATTCRSQAQLSGISTIVILMMSAVGGSMFPRIFMSETMQTIGLGTFNAWAIDGYQKVFWRQAPVLELWPQVLVLCTLAVVFLVVARLLARRWESC